MNNRFFLFSLFCYFLISCTGITLYESPGNKPEKPASNIFIILEIDSVFYKSKDKFVFVLDSTFKHYNLKISSKCYTPNSQINLDINHSEYHNNISDFQPQLVIKVVYGDKVEVNENFNVISGGANQQFTSSKTFSSMYFRVFDFPSYNFVWLYNTQLKNIDNITQSDLFFICRKVVNNMKKEKIIE